MTWVKRPTLAAEAALVKDDATLANRGLDASRQPRAANGERTSYRGAAGVLRAA